MGLFSSSGKNKQDSASEDSAYYSRAEDDSAGARARSKRASSAGEPAPRRSKEGRTAAPDPVLPEKKRARRRLVGAIALALAVAVGLPMLLDSEPKQLASDIAIQIPSKDKPMAEPAASAPAAAPVAAASAPAAPAAADTLDKREEFIAPPKAAAVVAAVPVVETAKADLPKPAIKAEPKPADAKPVVKADSKSAETKTADSKTADTKAAAKPDAKLAIKTVDTAKPAKADAADAAPDAARALAILEGKAAEPAAPKIVLQVAALASADKVAELQAKLKDAGIKSFTEKGASAAGEHVIRVRTGPYSRDEADKVRAKLTRIGLSASTVPG